MSYNYYYVSVNFRLSQLLSHDTHMHVEPHTEVRGFSSWSVDFSKIRDTVIPAARRPHTHTTTNNTDTQTHLLCLDFFFVRGDW